MENMALLTFFGLICVILLMDGPLTFLDFSIMQSRAIRMIILHFHIAHPCLCLYMSYHTVPKHTASNSAMASKVFPAWARYGLPSVSFVL